MVAVAKRVLVVFICELSLGFCTRNRGRFSYPTIEFGDSFDAASASAAVTDIRRFERMGHPLYGRWRSSSNRSRSSVQRLAGAEEVAAGSERYFSPNRRFL